MDYWEPYRVSRLSRLPWYGYIFWYLCQLISGNYITLIRDLFNISIWLIEYIANYSNVELIGSLTFDDWNKLKENFQL